MPTKKLALAISPKLALADIIVSLIVRLEPLKIPVFVVPNTDIVTLPSKPIFTLLLSFSFLSSVDPGSPVRYVPSPIK